MTSDRATRLGDNKTDMHISGDPPYTCDPSPLRYALLTTLLFNGLLVNTAPGWSQAINKRRRALEREDHTVMTV